MKDAIEAALAFFIVGAIVLSIGLLSLAPYVVAVAAAGWILKACGIL